MKKSSFSRIEEKALDTESLPKINLSKTAGVKETYYEVRDPKLKDYIKDLNQDILMLQFQSVSQLIELQK